MGIRIALGARRSTVINMVVKDAMRLERRDAACFGGALAGVPMGWIASQSVKSMFFGLIATDPRTTAGAAILLMVAAVRCILAGTPRSTPGTVDCVASRIIAEAPFSLRSPAIAYIKWVAGVIP
jgi:hypothetical protein